jgi:hypothetical protein
MEHQKLWIHLRRINLRRVLLSFDQPWRRGEGGALCIKISVLQVVRSKALWLGVLPQHWSRAGDWRCQAVMVAV